jgi:hypothetical protein
VPLRRRLLCFKPFSMRTTKASALSRRVRRIYATEFSLSNGGGWRDDP